MRWLHRLAAPVAAFVLLLAPAGLLVAAVGPQIVVAQKHRAFAPEAIAVERGAAVHFTNEDPFAHQLYVNSRDLQVDTDEQDPGSAVDISFPVAGDFTVMCRIHPKMTLAVHVQ